MVDRSTLRFATFLSASALAAIALGLPAFAETHEQIIAKCREAARPAVVACVQSKGGGRGNEAIIEACRQSVGKPIVYACVQREEQKQAGGVAAPPAPKGESAAAAKDAAPVQAAFVAPPRTIADITAILDSEKPNEAKIAERKANAEATPPANVSPAKLAQFYYDRGAARALLARNKDALADGLQALAAGKGAIEFKQISRIRQFVALRYRANGDPKQAISVFDSIVRDGNQPGVQGTMINALSNIAATLVSMGDVTQASTYAGRVGALVQEARGSPNPNWRAAYTVYGHSWEADNDSVRGLVFEARGQYLEAEAAYRRAEAFRRAAVKDTPKFDFPPPLEQMILAADSTLLWVARNETKQGRLNEAEADARRALLSVLAQQGKYAPATPSFIVGLAGILVEQGRYQEAEKLARAALDVDRILGIGDDAPATVTTLWQLGNILVLQRKTKDAAVVYSKLDKAIEQWAPQQREAFQLNGSRIVALYASGQVEAGIAAAEELVKRQTARTGDRSFDTAAARGILAIGYARAARDVDAVREFKASIPIMLAAARENADDDDATVVAARSARLQRIVEAYIGVLLRSPNMSNDVAIETFALADAVRGHAVQKALADSSARAVAKDPALAQLVRTEQDLAKQISAQLGALNNLLALPSAERDDGNVSAITVWIGRTRTMTSTAGWTVPSAIPVCSALPPTAIPPTI